MSNVDITEFLLARIAEDEAAALPFRNDFGHVKRWRADEVGGKVRQVGPTEFGLPDVILESDLHLIAAHIARWDPARVLAECEAKREMVEDLREELANQHDPEPTTLQLAERILRLLALPYADHPDYREEWRP